jgi:hypothetical protein
MSETSMAPDGNCLVTMGESFSFISTQRLPSQLYSVKLSIERTIANDYGQRPGERPRIIREFYGLTCGHPAGIVSQS